MQAQLSKRLINNKRLGHITIVVSQFYFYISEKIGGESLLIALAPMTAIYLILFLMY